MAESSNAAQAPATASLTLSAGSGQFTIAGQDAAAAAQLARLRAISAEQTARRARRTAIQAELEQLRADGRAGEFEAAALFKELTHPSRADELEALRHTTAYPL